MTTVTHSITEVYHLSLSHMKLWEYMGELLSHILNLTSLGVSKKRTMVGFSQGHDLQLLKMVKGSKCCRHKVDWAQIILL